MEVVIFGLGSSSVIPTKAEYGGKGATLIEMSGNGIPVPPGMVIPCGASISYLEYVGSRGDLMELIMAQVDENFKHLACKFNYVPLVSVRSGARVSMPGMMDTILNVGLTDTTLTEWEERIGVKAALDSYRRLIQMYGEVVMGAPAASFEGYLHSIKKDAGVEKDSDLSEEDYRDLIKRYKLVIKECTGEEFPQTVHEQVEGAITAVFKSWDNPRAKAYREMNSIPYEWGTAVTIQMMVFGNMNDQSGTGVLFTRCPSTGQHKLTGEYLINAQGEDVVAGIRTPESIGSMPEWNEGVSSKLMDIAHKLETLYKDMQDIEFTVQDGELFILQTRNGKRSAKAAFKIAYDLTQSGLISVNEATKRVTGKDFLVLSKPIIDPSFNHPPHGVGIAAGGGLVTGRAVFSNESAINCTEPCILVSKETTPDDIEGMNASVGILTSTGGLTSHAAVVARGMNKSCVVGCTQLVITGGEAKLGADTLFTEGATITIDGATGNIWVGIKVPVQKGEVSYEAKALMAPKLFERGIVIKDTCLTQHVCYMAREYTPEDLLDKLQQITSAGTTVVVDFTTREAEYNEVDNEFYAMLGTPVDVEFLEVELLAIHLKAWQKGLSKGQLKHVSVISQYGDLHFSKLGCGVVKTVSSMSVALSTDGICKVDPQFISQVFGAQETFEEFMGIMKKAGKKFAPMGEVMSVTRAAFEVLG